MPPHPRRRSVPVARTRSSPAACTSRSRSPADLPTRPRFVGGVESYLNASAAGKLVFPAMSVQLPDRDTLAPVRTRVGRTANCTRPGPKRRLPPDRTRSSAAPGFTSRSRLGLGSPQRSRPAASRRTSSSRLPPRSCSRPDRSTCPEAPRDATVRSRVVGLVHEATPDSRVHARHVEPTGWLYQLFLSGQRASDAGGARSSPVVLEGQPLTALLVLPALSVHVPESPGAAASGPE